MKERVYNAQTAQTNLIQTSEKRRYWELDFLRGLCVILMVIDHFLYSSFAILGTSVWNFAGREFWKGLQLLAEIYWFHNARRIAQYIVISVFFLLCGISCTLSHNNALRGLKTLAVGILITVVTYLADSFFRLGVLIKFGVIHMLGCSILIFSLIDLLGWGIEKAAALIVKKIAAKSDESSKGRTATLRVEKIALWVRKLLPFAVGVIGLIIYFTLPWGHFGMADGHTIKIDGEYVKFGSYVVLYSDVSPVGKSNGFLNFLSIFIELNVPGYWFGGADYFSILPYAFIVLIGSGIGRLVYETKAKAFSDYIMIPPLGLVMLVVCTIRRAVSKRTTRFFINLDGIWNKPIAFVGRRALIVYLLHQLAIVAFFFAVGGIVSLTT